VSKTISNNCLAKPLAVSPWMDPEETAAYLGIALGTLRNWVSQKYVPHVKRGRIVRFHRERIDAWLFAKECKGRKSRADFHAHLQNGSP
jgi:excisionase family DNA binding protein